MKESDLYSVLEQFYVDQGYIVKGEVCSCDLVAIKNETTIIIELKLSFNIKLLYQAVRRLAITDYVYVAIPKPVSKQKMSYWTMLKSLSRRLHIGLIVVNGDDVKILCEPATFTKKNSARLKKNLLNEFEGRKAGHNTGGTTGTKLQTAYLEYSVQIATLLAKHKKLSAKSLRDLGADQKAYQILYNNHYGWFEKKAKGVYGLKRGIKARIKKQYPVIWHYYESRTTESN